MARSIHKLQIEVINLENVEDISNYLDSNSLHVYKDFILENVFFVEVNTDIYKQLLRDNRIKVHTGNFAYQMK